MLQMLVLVMNIAFAQDSLSYLLENKKEMNLLSNGLNKPTSQVESRYNFTKPAALIDVVRSKDPGGYYLKVEKGTSSVSDIVEVYRQAPKKFATRKVTLDSFQRVTGLTDCAGGTSKIGNIISSLECVSVNREYCQQIANDRSIGDFSKIQEQLKQCNQLSGKLKRIVDIHSKQMKGGALSKQFTEDTDKLKSAFQDVLVGDFDMEVFPKNAIFKAETDAGVATASKIIEMCGLQKTSEGPMWASSPTKASSGPAASKATR